MPANNQSNKKEDVWSLSIKQRHKLFLIEDSIKSFVKAYPEHILCNMGYHVPIEKLEYGLSMHIPVVLHAMVGEILSRYGMTLTIPKKTKQKLINYAILNADHRHYQRNGLQR